MTDFEESIAQARESALSDNGNPNHGLKLKAKGNDGTFVYGAPNFKIVSKERIIDLASAIVRGIDGAVMTRENIGVMVTWARELEKQLEMLDTMLIYEWVSD